MKLTERNLEDLTAINGIGPARQKWLKESLDVQTFGDLAALTVDEIASQFKADKQIVSREAIKAWILQAHKHAVKAKRAEKPTKSKKGTKSKEVKVAAEANQANSRRAKSEKGENGGNAKISTPRDGWKPFASFVIEYQERTVDGQVIEYRTTAHHMESDIGTNWPGIEHEKHCHWMLVQLGDRMREQPDHVQTPAMERPVEPVPAARKPVRLEIAQIRVFQPSQANKPVGTGKPDQPFDGTIRSDVPFSLEVLFNLIGEAAAELTEEHVVFSARAYVQDLSTGKSIHLGDFDPGLLEKSELTYEAVLPDITLAAGTYRLFALVTLQAMSVRPDFVSLPEFRVVR